MTWPVNALHSSTANLDLPMPELPTTVAIFLMADIAFIFYFMYKWRKKIFFADTPKPYEREFQFLSAGL
jgi:hypothetical protein